MKQARYLIVGGGMTAAAAVAGIREVDPDGSIAVVGGEDHPPYKRPPLTKKLWTGKPLESIWLEAEQPGVEFVPGRWIEQLDPEQKRAVDNQGQTYTYERLLLATGGTPRRLPQPLAGVGEQVIYFRTLDDYLKLRTPPDPSARVAVIGGGFIGAELAASLAMNGRKVTMIFPEEWICRRLFASELGRFLNETYRAHGVEIYPGELVQGLEARGDQLVLTTDRGTQIQAGQVVAGLGITPNVALAEAAGLKVENGIVVDETLHTSRPEIFAAGDVASFYNPLLGMRLRVEHADNATAMGQAAGRNMAGANEPYEHLPFFYSDMFDLGYEAVGELDSRLEVVANWQEPKRTGVLYYLRDGLVRGVLLWNVWDKVDQARSLLNKPLDTENFPI